MLDEQAFALLGSCFSVVFKFGSGFFVRMFWVRLPRPTICESPDTAHPFATEHTQCRAISGAIFVGLARDNEKLGRMAA
jgi:hypothetical protein